MDFRNEYTYNWFTKLKYLRKYSMKEKKFWFFRIVSDMLYLTAVIATVWIGVSMAGDLMGTGFSLDVFFLFAVTLCLTLVLPATFGLAIMQSGMNRCAIPFCERRHEFIKLYEDGVEFYYEQAGDHTSYCQMQYRIAREDISGVDYDEVNHIITIRGQGTIVGYSDFAAGKISYEKKLEYRFDVGDPSFQILDAFKAGDRDEIIGSLKEMAIWEKEDSPILTEDEAQQNVQAEVTAKKQEQLKNSVWKYAAGIVIENEVGGAIMIAAFAGMLLYMLTDMITSITADESTSDSVLLVCALMVFVGFAGLVRTMILVKTDKWNRVTRAVGSIKDLSEETQHAVYNSAVADLCEKITGEENPGFEMIADARTAGILIVSVTGANKIARSLASALGRKIPKLFVKCLIAALALFTALDISAGARAIHAEQDCLERCVSTTRALNEVFPKAQVNPYGKDAEDYIQGVYYFVDVNRRIRIRMNEQGNISEIWYDADGTRDKSQLAAYVNEMNERLIRTGRVPKKLTDPIPQKILDEFNPQKEEMNVKEKKGKVSCGLYYNITESYDGSPDEDGLSYRVKLER
ncbi:MAG: hypothetical protein LKF52_14165 [Butyrivibrio sp.]|nr:hypothetical protein [Butyrivibrio sp.]